MSIEAAIFQQTISDSVIAAALASDGGVKVYPGAAPQETKPPLIVFQRISTNPEYNQDMAVDIVVARVQVEAWAKEHDAALALAEKFNRVWSGFRGSIYGFNIHGVFLEDERPIFNDDLEIWAVQSDYFFSYTEA